MAGIYHRCTKCSHVDTVRHLCTACGNPTYQPGLCGLCTMNLTREAGYTAIGACLAELFAGMRAAVTLPACDDPRCPGWVLNDGGADVQRCDVCARFPDDFEAAAAALKWTVERGESAETVRLWHAALETLTRCRECNGGGEKQDQSGDVCASCGGSGIAVSGICEACGENPAAVRVGGGAAATFEVCATCAKDDAAAE